MDNEGSFLNHHRSSWHLRALRMQWFGVVLLFLAAALAALTDFFDHSAGVAVLIAFAVFGLLTLLVARLILLSPAGRLRSRHP